MKKLILTMVAMLTLATCAFAQIGSLSSDLVFTPVTPCRIIDTRLVLGQIPAGSTRVYNAGNTAGFANQGGSATNCGVTAGLNTAAVAVNFVAVAPAAAGYITVYPNGGTQPEASTLNYVAGDIVANSAIVKVSQTGITAMSIFSSAATHVVADVVGYYSKPVSTALECIDVSGTAISVAAGTQGTATSPGCTTGYTQTATSCESYAPMPIVYSRYGICIGQNNGTSPQTLGATRTCCRIPGR